MSTVQRLPDFRVDIAVRTSLCCDVLQFEICVRFVSRLRTRTLCVWGGFCGVCRSRGNWLAGLQMRELSCCNLLRHKYGICFSDVLRGHGDFFLS